MWRKLLLPSAAVLLCALVNPAVSVRTDVEEIHEKRTMGASGIRCTPQGKKCIANATCVDSRCTCPPGQKGQAQIECVDKSEKVCLVSGDPHMSAFGRASVDVDLPCRFRAARFVTRNVKGATSHATCAVEVYATSLQLEGDFVIRSVHISVGVTDPALQAHSQVEVYKSRQYNVNDSTIYNYQSRIISRDGIWGSAQEEVEGVKITPSFDDVNNFAMLEVPHCEIRIKYRAFDPARPRHQQQLPGVTIMAPSHSEFISGKGSYPEALCGTPEDGPLMYRKRAAELGVVDPETAVIYDILKNKPAQHDNPDAAQCEAAFASFNSSTNQSNDLNNCSFLLTKSAVAKCLDANNLPPLTTFTACLNRLQNKSRVADCDVMKLAARLCGDQAGWVGPTDYTCPAPV